MRYGYGEAQDSEPTIRVNGAEVTPQVKICLNRASEPSRERIAQALSHSHIHPTLQPNPQWHLFPQRKRLLLSPLPNIHSFNVKLPQQPCEYQSGLRPSKFLSNATARAHRKRLQRVGIRPSEVGVLIGRKPAVREKCFGGGKVERGVVSCVLRVGDESLAI